MASVKQCQNPKRRKTMRQETIKAVQVIVKTVLAADPTVTAEEMTRIMRACQGQPPRQDLLTAAPATTQPAPPSFRTLTPDQAGEKIGVCTRTILYWVRTGKLPAKKYGRRTIRILESDLAAFVAPTNFSPEDDT
jgi:excisionase family DNA binding protein